MNTADPGPRRWTDAAAWVQALRRVAVDLIEAMDRLREREGHEDLGRALAPRAFEDGVEGIEEQIRKAMGVGEQVVARRERDLLEAQDEMAVAERGVAEIRDLFEAARARFKAEDRGAR